MVKVNNNQRQQDIDKTGDSARRMLNVNALLISACQCVALISYVTQFDCSCFTDTEYELVAIHPEHFLPCGSVLPVLRSGSSTPTIYVPARDRRLRESADPDSPRLPTLRHVTESRIEFDRLNVFLVILNAEIKFHRYLRMISQNPPTTPLPADVLDLMHLTVELVDLLYWKPVPTKGSQGEAELAKVMEFCRRMEGDEAMDNRTRSRVRFRLPAHMDVEARKAYGRALMGGHGALPSHSSSRIWSIEYFIRPSL